MKRQYAYTLIELIAVITVVAIMAVSVAPKFFSKDDYSTVTVRDTYIAHLRLVQLKAMNHRGVCHNSVFQNVGGVMMFGIPTNTSSTCGTTTEVDSRIGTEGNTINLVNGATNAVIKASPSIVFDGLGIPSTGGDCTGACKFQVLGNETHYLCIESQGYIHRVESGYVCT